MRAAISGGGNVLRSSWFAMNTVGRIMTAAASLNLDSLEDGLGR
jgi:hypothetical protein